MSNMPKKRVPWSGTQTVAEACEEQLPNDPADLEAFLADYVDPYGRTTYREEDELVGDYSELLDLMHQLHQVWPDQRFGQLVSNVVLFASKKDFGNAYSIPDRVFLDTLRKLVRSQQARLAANAESREGQDGSPAETASVGGRLPATASVK